MDNSRVVAYGEVFTPQYIVTDMCDLLPEEILQNPHKRVLEPSCGEGVFLLEVLSRKLRHCITNACLPFEGPNAYKGFMVDCAIIVASLYGIDIQESNVKKCREALYSRVVDFVTYTIDGNMPGCYLGTFKDRIWGTICKNIVQGDTLAMLNEQGEPIIFYEWKYRIDGVMEAIPRAYKDIVNGNQLVAGATQLYRFWDDV